MADSIPATNAADPLKRLRTAAVLSLPLILAAIFLFAHPFKQELVSRVFSLVELNSKQQCNIAVAAHALNGYVIEADDTFSFNKVVGPRTDARGYRSAPSYVGPNSPATFGGGICLLSSALYQAALIAGLDVQERSPHMRTIASVEPGLDATVWYGQSDLKIVNNKKNALQIKSEVKDHKLYVQLFSANKDRQALANLKTVVCRQSRSELLVEVFSESEGKRRFISRDHYQLAR